MAALQDYMKYVEYKIDYWRAVEAHDARAAARIARESRALILTLFAEHG